MCHDRSLYTHFFKPCMMKGVCPRFKNFDGYNFFINPLYLYPSKNKMAASGTPKSIGKILISY